MKEEIYYLKLTGKVNIPKKLEISHNYAVLLQGSVTDTKTSDNENGSFDVTSTFRPVTCDIKTDLGEMIKAKDPRGWSAKIRARVYKTWEANSDPRSAEEAYESFMKQVNFELEELYEKSQKH